MEINKRGHREGRQALRRDLHPTQVNITLFSGQAAENPNNRRKVLDFAPFSLPLQPNLAK